MAQVSLKDWQWKHRILILSVADRSAQQVQDQVSISSHTGFAGRDLRLLILQDGETYQASGAKIDFSLAAIEDKFDYDRDEVMLIGKDGGVKLLKPLPVSREDIFVLIDGMPMRQAEMRKKGDQ